MLILLANWVEGQSLGLAQPDAPRALKNSQQVLQFAAVGILVAQKRLERRARWFVKVRRGLDCTHLSFEFLSITLELNFNLRRLENTLLERVFVGGCGRPFMLRLFRRDGNELIHC